MMKVLITILILNSDHNPMIEIKLLQKTFDTVSECHDASGEMMQRFKRFMSEEAKDSGGGMTYRCRREAVDE